VAEISKSVHSLDNKFDKLMTDNQALKAENADLTKEIGILRTTQADNRDSNIQLFHELSTLAAAHAAEYDKFEKDRGEYKARIEELEKELAALKRVA
jgi:predicted RNase H-like nuclease (RuvC/YqgF family)